MNGTKSTNAHTTHKAAHPIVSNLENPKDWALFNTGAT